MKRYIRRYIPFVIGGIAALAAIVFVVLKSVQSKTLPAEELRNRAEISLETYEAGEENTGSYMDDEEYKTYQVLLHPATLSPTGDNETSSDTDADNLNPYETTSSSSPETKKKGKEEMEEEEKEEDEKKSTEKKETEPETSIFHYTPRSIAAEDEREEESTEDIGRTGQENSQISKEEEETRERRTYDVFVYIPDKTKEASTETEETTTEYIPEREVLPTPQTTADEIVQPAPTEPQPAPTEPPAPQQEPQTPPPAQPAPAEPVQPEPPQPETPEAVPSSEIPSVPEEPSEPSSELSSEIISSEEETEEWIEAISTEEDTEWMAEEQETETVTDAPAEEWTEEYSIEEFDITDFDAASLEEISSSEQGEDPALVIPEQAGEYQDGAGETPLSGNTAEINMEDNQETLFPDNNPESTGGETTPSSDVSDPENDTEETTAQVNKEENTENNTEPKAGSSEAGKNTSEAENGGVESPDPAAPSSAPAPESETNPEAESGESISNPESNPDSTEDGTSGENEGNEGNGENGENGTEGENETGTPGTEADITSTSEDGMSGVESTTAHDQESSTSTTQSDATESSAQDSSLPSPSSSPSDPGQENTGEQGSAERQEDVGEEDGSTGGIAIPEEWPSIPQEEVSGVRLSVVEYAKSWCGVCNYVWGGNDLSPGGGVDCSGFTKIVYERIAGISLPRSSREYVGVGVEVSPDNVMPGDIIVYDGHVAIYAGNGMIVHARTEETGIRMDTMYFMPIVSCRSVLP